MAIFQSDSSVRLRPGTSFAFFSESAFAFGGLLGKYKGNNLGTFGCFATQSFHETKNGASRFAAVLKLSTRVEIRCNRRSGTKS